MMIMRPPQHGHGGRDAGGSSAPASASSDSSCGGAAAIGEQAVVADAMEAAGQHVNEKAADELVAGQRHDLVPLPALGAVVLPPEGDAGVVAGDEAAVGDGAAVGVAAEIGEHRLWPGE